MTVVVPSDLGMDSMSSLTFPLNEVVSVQCLIADFAAYNMTYRSFFH